MTHPHSTTILYQRRVTYTVTWRILWCAKVDFFVTPVVIAPAMPGAFKPLGLPLKARQVRDPARGLQLIDRAHPSVYARLAFALGRWRCRLPRSVTSPLGLSEAVSTRITVQPLRVRSAGAASCASGQPLRCPGGVAAADASGQPLRCRGGVAAACASGQPLRCPGGDAAAYASGQPLRRRGSMCREVNQILQGGLVRVCFHPGGVYGLAAPLPHPARRPGRREP